jgi:hypothetical protein
METVDLCSSSEGEISSHSPRKKRKEEEEEEEELLVCLSSDDDDDDDDDEEYLKMPMILSVPPKSLSPPAADSDYDSFSDFEVRKLHTTSTHHILTSNETRGPSKREYHADLELPFSSSIPIPKITRETDSDSSEEELEITDKQPLKLAAARKYLSSEDDDSSDDDLLFNSALSKPRTREDRRKTRRQEQNVEKSRSKATNKAEIQHIRSLKTFQKEQEKISKASKKDNAKQRSGKFAKDEIAVIVEPSLKESVYVPLQELEHTYGYKGVEHNGLDHGTVVFIRRDALKGGAESAVTAMKSGRISGFEFLNKLIVIFADPNKFLELLEKHDDETDNYLKLEEYISELRRSWNSSWKELNQPTPKITLLLPSVKKALNKLWHSSSTHLHTSVPNLPPRDFELEDAAMWCSIQFSVDIIPLSGDEQLTDFLQKMTRTISETPYRDQVTELECIKKIRSDLPATARPHEKARDTWERMLLQVPQLSLQRARNVTQVYPTMMSLWNDYQNLEASDVQKEAAIADCLGGKSQQMKISQSLFRILTSSDPNELI